MAVSMILGGGDGENLVGQKAKVVAALMRAKESNARLKDLNSKVLKKLLMCKQD
jgi:hypothetical protein